MKAVKTQQKYQCDFCKRRSVKHVIALHEKRCYRNPDRFCDACKNTGKVEGDVVDGIGVVMGDCPYCSAFDKQKLKEIQEREEASETDSIESMNEVVPF